MAAVPPPPPGKIDTGSPRKFLNRVTQHHLRHSATPTASDLILEFIEQPPEFIFPGESVEARISFKNEVTKKAVRNSAVVEFSLDIPEEHKIAGVDINNINKLLVTHQRSLQFQNRTEMIFVFKLADGAVNKTFNLRVHCPELNSTYLSEHFTCVNLRLQVTRAPIPKFFKDEPRVPALECKVALKDKRGQTMRGISFYIGPKVVYSDTLQAVDEEVLIIEPKRDRITRVKMPETGELTIKYRYTCVSKNVNGRHFCLRLDPPNSENFNRQYGLIGGVITGGVQVLSKKRPSKRQAAAAAENHMMQSSSSSSHIPNNPQITRELQALRASNNTFSTTIEGIQGEMKDMRTEFIDLKKEMKFFRDECKNGFEKLEVLISSIKDPQQPMIDANDQLPPTTPMFYKLPSAGTDPVMDDSINSFLKLDSDPSDEIGVWDPPVAYRGDSATIDVKPGMMLNVRVNGGGNGLLVRSSSLMRDTSYRTTVDPSMPEEQAFYDNVAKNETE